MALASLLEWIKGLFSGKGRKPKPSSGGKARPAKKARKPADVQAAPDSETATSKPKKKKKPASDPSKAKKAGKARSAAPDASVGEAKPKAKSKKASAKPAKKSGKKKAPSSDLDIKLAKGKKKKPAEPEPPEPSGEEDELAYGVQIKKKKAERRKAFRVPISSMQAVLHGEETAFQVRDLSVMGVGVVAEGAGMLKPGKVVHLDLVDKGAPVAEKVQAKVMRKQSDMIGLMFVEMRRRDEDTLYDIVLREQKRMAERRRNKGG